MRVLVCGGRDFKNYDLVRNTLDNIFQFDGPFPVVGSVIIHGGARGADSFADRWAINNYVQIDEYPADWKKHGRAAGPIRNQRMLDEGKPDLVVAFPGGRGTADMVRRARAAKIRVIEPATATFA